MNCIFNKDSIVGLFNEKKNSHAFLVNTNNISSTLNDILDVVRKINCKTGNDDCNCKSCTMTLNKTNPDVLIISPEGKEIKKESIESLMSLFSTSPLVSKYSIYIILNADLMNQTSANKILKFLEEPEKNIIGFFVTDKLFNIIDTIKSRCQIFDSFYEVNNFFDYFNITEEEFNLYFDESMKLLDILNLKKNYQIINYVRKLSKKERNDLIKIFDILNKMYILKYEKLTGSNYDFNYANDIFNKILENDLSIILTRIKLLNDLVEKIRYNVNKELIMNKTFLEWI